MKLRRVVLLMLAVALFAPAALGGCAKDDGSPEVPGVTELPTEVPTEAPTEEPKPGDVELYQLAPENQSLMECYVIRTPQNKIIVIDGGIDGFGKDKDPYLPSAIRAILGIGQNDYFEVEAWFLSHGHKDHFSELGKMLQSYTAESNYRINNFYFNFPEFGREWVSAGGENDYDLPELELLKQGIDNYYSLCGFNGIEGASIPEEEYAKPADAEYNYYYDLINGAVITPERIEEGLDINVDGVNFRVLQTWAKTNSVVNSTSTVLRMTYGEHSVLFLGDSFTDNASRLIRAWPLEDVISEYVQMGHHGQHGPDKAFYRRIDASDSIRLWPCPIWVWEVYKATNNIATDETRKWVGLPEDFNEFYAQDLDKTGRDFVAGYAGAYPEDPTQVASWNADVLNAQRVAVFEYIGQ